MPRLPRNKLPAYRRHKARDLAVVTLSGKDHYLGTYGTQASKDCYDRLVAEWMANGRRLPASSDDQGEITVIEFLAAYWRYAQIRYVKDGNPTSEQWCIKAVAHLIREMYGHAHVSEFGPIALRAIRQRMIDDNHSRKHINDQNTRAKTMFKWGVVNEFVPPTVLQALQAVVGLRQGEAGIRDTKPVRPVPEEHVEAIKPFVSRQVWAMVQLQRLTGMRQGEVITIRRIDLDTTNQIWRYEPASHKTEHHGHPRVVELGPRAQEVIKPFLKANLEAFLFSPAEAEIERHAEQRKQRRTSTSSSYRSSMATRHAPICRT